jgi:hypothetical protein
MVKQIGVLLAACSMTACGGGVYAFVPATHANAEVYGHSAAEYAIPPQAPRGALTVASLGVEAVSPGDAPDAQLSALHIRVTISNTSTQPWTFDTPEQQLFISQRGSSTPAFASASPGGSGPPSVSVAPQSTRIVDLFFPLPDDMQESSEIPGFQLTSHVRTDAGVVSEATPFDRVEVDDDSAYAYGPPRGAYLPYGYGYGYDYWDSPFWYNPGYVGFYGVHFAYWGHPIYARGGFARGGGWGRPGYYHGGYHSTYRGGAGGGFHGGGGHGGRR